MRPADAGQRNNVETVSRSRRYRITLSGLQDVRIGHYPPSCHQIRVEPRDNLGWYGRMI